MKISIDGRASTIYRGTGIGNYTYQILKNINQIDKMNDYNIYIPSNSSLDIQLGDNFKINTCTNLSKNNFWQDVGEENKILMPCDIYHTPQNGVGILKNSEIPQIITLHDIIPLKMRETVSNNYLEIFDNQMPKIMQTIDGIITVSEFSKKDIHETLGFPKEKIFVTKLASESQYKILNKNIAKKFIETTYNLKNDFILYVGGFSPRKNIIGLIEAFNLSKNKLKKDTKLVIIGYKGASYEMYKNKALSLNLENDVIFTGFIESSHMPYFYNCATMLVYPSFYEGFGLPPLEAMACGTPVICSNITSIPEVVEDGAMLINPSDITEISNSIIKLSNDENFRQDLIHKGLKQSQKYSWKKTAMETINAYTSIIKNV